MIRTILRFARIIIDAGLALLSILGMQPVSVVIDGVEQDWTLSRLFTKQLAAAGGLITLMVASMASQAATKTELIDSSNYTMTLPKVVMIG